MNREIKFRFWDPKRSCMAIECHYPTYDKGINEQIARCKLEVMQWTGLKDKNGKEIYEGDIVKTRRGIRTVTFGLGGEGEPADYVGAYYGWCIGEDTDETNGFRGDDVEVIGNIHENPELLEKGNQ